jgi:hypothetical protein
MMWVWDGGCGCGVWVWGGGWGGVGVGVVCVGGAHWAKSENSVRLRKFEQNQTFIWIFGFIFSKTCKKVVLDGKKVVLDGKKVFCLQNKPCRLNTFWSAARPSTGKHLKNTKNQPKIGELLALKLVWTPLLRIFAAMFDFLKYIMVKLI